MNHFITLGSLPTFQIASTRRLAKGKERAREKCGPVAGTPQPGPAHGPETAPAPTDGLQPIPAAPTLSGEALLEIFVHPSLIPLDAPLEEPYGNGRRLQLLGTRMLDAAYAAVVMQMQPNLQKEALQVRI